MRLIASILKLPLAVLVCVVGCAIGLASLALAATPDCFPIGGETLVAAPSWLPDIVKPWWNDLVTTAAAGYVLTHLRAAIPDNGKLGFAMSVLDKLAGNYLNARNVVVK